ncbi:MAG TPA: NAD(P)H-binding protein [Kofleriaceae bacterium]
MTAFVLGATGFVGREVVRQLAVRATPVVAHVRPKSAAEWTPKLEALGAKVDASEWDAAALSAAIDAAGANQLYILIGTTKSRAKAESVDGDIYEKIDYGLTRIAVDAAIAAKAKPRLVYLSGLGADANARGAYMKARGKAEDAVRNSGLEWVIARPAIITGERDESRPGERAGAIVGDGLLAVAGLFSKSLKTKWSSTTPDVLASALIRIGEGSEHDRVFDGLDLR